MSLNKTLNPESLQWTHLGALVTGESTIAKQPPVLQEHTASSEKICHTAAGLYFTRKG